MDLHNRRTSALVLLTLLLLTALIYWRGLSGPFLLDDPYGLQDLNAWRQGKQSLWMVFFGNESLLMHRALAMASFALNVVIGGDSTFSFKVGNLLHHLATGTFVYLLAKQMFSQDARATAQAGLLALVVTALWLLHPLHVSTVLYIIQRMAQVAAFCCIVGMWLYMFIRLRMQAGVLRHTHGMIALWIVVPLLTFLGIQGKQNAAVLPALCLVLELAYFSRIRNTPVALRWFFSVLVIAPTIAVFAGLLLGLKQFYMGYWIYDFGMGERLLSESRALWVYIRETLAPYPPGMGIYGDDFAVSRGLLAPPSTLFSIISLIAVSAAAIRLRKRLPSLYAGWFIFLIGHAVESSFLPLELYYEHRNYLPSVGLLICAIVLVREALQALASNGITTYRIAGAAALGALTVVVVQTGGRVHVWQRLDTILRSSVAAHPDSIHANYALLNSLVQAKEYAEIEDRLDKMSRSSNQRVKAAALVYRMNVACSAKRDASPEDLQAYLRLIPQTRIDLIHLQALGSLVDIAERKPSACGRVTFKMLGDELSALAERAVDQPVESFTRYTTRHQAARMYIALGDSHNAIIQARLAWQPQTPASYSATLIRALLLEDRFDEAEQVFVQATARSNPNNQFDRNGLRIMRELIDKTRNKALVPPPD